VWRELAKMPLARRPMRKRRLRKRRLRKGRLRRRRLRRRRESGRRRNRLERQRKAAEEVVAAAKKEAERFEVKWSTWRRQEPKWLRRLKEKRRHNQRVIEKVSLASTLPTPQ
jgi:hypothetical protein